VDIVLHSLLHTLKHSLILLPFLFISYILIEVIEYFSANNLQHSKLLSNKWSTLFGAGFGLVPQCGFSVVATDLFASHKIKIGTLLAVYIATSDEAIPLLITAPHKTLSLIPLLLIKFFVAILVGYLVDFLFKKANKKHLSHFSKTPIDNKLLTNTEIENLSKHESISNQENHHIGCCGHDIQDNTKKSKVKKFILHPLIHTLKIFGFILLINFIFNVIIELVGEDSLKTFLLSGKHFAPLLSSIIGLIPNCASSVIITELYLIDGISFGACLGGLIVNAGIAFVILFKQNKNHKQNFAILGGMLLIGITVGYIIQLLGF